MTLQDLGRLPFEAALPLAERKGYGTRSDWADQIGVAPSVVNRAFSCWQGDKHYFVSFCKLPELMLAMRSMLLLDWARERTLYLAKQYGLDLEQAEPVDCISIKDKLAHIVQEVGEVAGEVRSATEDGELDGQEIKRLQKELADVVNVACDLEKSLAAKLEEIDTK